MYSNESQSVALFKHIQVLKSQLILINKMKPFTAYESNLLTYTVFNQWKKEKTLSCRSDKNVKEW